MFKDKVLPQLLAVITDEDKREFVETMYPFINYREKLIYLALKMKKCKNTNDIQSVKTSISEEMNKSEEFLNRLFSLCNKYEISINLPTESYDSAYKVVDLIINEIFSKNSKFSSEDILNNYMVHSDDDIYLLEDFLSNSDLEITEITPCFDLRSINEDQILVNNMISYFTQMVSN